MTGLAHGWASVTHVAVFGVALTVVAYVLAVALWHRAHRTPLLTPVLGAVIIVIALLALTHTSYDDYMVGGKYLSFLLGPATVALAVPLYRAMPTIRRLLLPVATGVIIGSTAAMVSAMVLVRALGGSRTLEVTMAPKSTTTPIAIALAQSAGGLPSLAAVVVILTGVLGAVVGPWLLTRLRVQDPQIRGLALGVSAHGIGTSRALEESATGGAFAALAMALSGIVTALLLPALVRLLA